MFDMTAGHFVFIPAVLLLGMVVGWILGSRAAADAYAAELRRREGAGSSSVVNGTARSRLSVVSREARFMFILRV